MAKKVESLAEETRPENEAENFSGKNAAQEDSEKEANASGICCFSGRVEYFCVLHYFDCFGCGRHISAFAYGEASVGN